MSIFLYKSMRPVVASLSMNEEKVLQSAEYYRLQGCRHISVVRFDGPLFFANASYLDEQVLKFRNDRPDLRYVLLDARGINDMDASGEEALSLLVKRMRSADLGFAMCGLKGQVLNVMKRTGLYEEIGREHIYADSRAAIAALIKTLHTDTDLPAEGCENCPLTTYLPLAEEEDHEVTAGDGSIIEKLFAAAAFAEQHEFDTAQELMGSTTNPNLKGESKP